MPKGRLFLLFACVAVITLFYNVKRTYNEVAEARWNEGGYAYSTLDEYKDLTAVNQLIKQADKFTWFQDSWLQHRFWRIREALYESAIQKIPANDGERMLWFYMAKFSPYMKESGRGGQREDEVFKAVLEQLLQEPKMDYKSLVVRNVSRHIFLNQYILFLRDRSEFYQLPSATRRSVYEAAFRQMEQLDVRKILSYKEHREYPIVYMTLFSSYYFLAKGMQSDVICDSQGAGWWSLANEKVRRHLIQKPSRAFDAIKSKEKDRQRFESLEEQFLAGNAALLSLSKKCMSKN
ncbi:MAG: hypothetical protein DI582_08110 [Azospirillum brasilense]|nr:MAG: hypothetical protein DI582_08110 [Azospirillum brasilense]